MEIYAPLTILLNTLLAVTDIFGIIFLSSKKNGKPDKARKILYWLLSLSSIFCLMKVSETVICPTVIISQEVMVLPYMLLFLFFQCFQILYPMELLKPNWMNWKKILLIFSPFIIVTLLYSLLHFENVQLYGMYDIIANIKKPDVIFRVTVLALFIPYTIFLPLFQFQDKHTDVINLGLFVYTLGLVFDTILIAIIVTTGKMEYYVILSINNFCLALYLIYYELRVRTPYILGKGSLDEAAGIIYHAQQPSSLSETEEKEERNEQLFQNGEETSEIDAAALKEEQTTEDKIFHNILYQLDVREIWRYPNLDLESFAREAGTNKTYVLKCIKQRTGFSYVEYINKRRIDYVLRELKRDCHQSLQYLFKSAGYNSRTTAWRNFKNMVGITPTEYVRQLRAKGK